MSREAIDELKRCISLLDYLQAHEWRPVRHLTRGRVMGVCPLHDDSRPSFLVDVGKNLFYCYGCGSGGDLFRFVELYHGVRFAHAFTLLQQWQGEDLLLRQASDFYRMQLHRHAEAHAYLHRRGIRAPDVIEIMRVGYAPGACLRGAMVRMGYSVAGLRRAGLITEQGRDTFVRRIVFPLDGNLYGRSISTTAPPHRFLPGCKGGLYGWEEVRGCPDIILVEGLFDYAAVRQAGFHNVTCSLGSHLNVRQLRQLCEGFHTVYLAFDADRNGSGQSAAQALAARLTERGVKTFRITLPDGTDPCDFFARGGGPCDFRALLENARP